MPKILNIAYIVTLSFLMKRDIINFVTIVVVLLIITQIKL